MLELLAQLTFAPRVPRDAFAERVQELAAGQERVLVVSGAQSRSLQSTSLTAPRKTATTALSSQLEHCFWNGSWHADWVCADT